jgi:hypothetical protein
MRPAKAIQGPVHAVIGALAADRQLRRGHPDRRPGHMSGFPRACARDSTGAPRPPRARPWLYQPADQIGWRLVRSADADHAGHRKEGPCPQSLPGSNTAIEIYCEDHGVGQLMVLIHGYPLSGRPDGTVRHLALRPHQGRPPTDASPLTLPAARPGILAPGRRQCRGTPVPQGCLGPADQGVGPGFYGRGRLPGARPW